MADSKNSNRAMAQDSLTSSHLKQALVQTGELRESMSTAAISQRLQALASAQQQQNNQSANTPVASPDKKQGS